MTRRLLIALGLFAIGFVFAGLQGRSPDSGSPGPQEPAWQVAMPRATQAPASKAQLRQQTWLRSGNDAPIPGKKVAKPKTAPAWQIVGVVQEPTGSYVLVLQRGEVVQIPVGGILPDGSVLNSVDADAVQVTDGETRRRIGLYQ